MEAWFEFRAAARPRQIDLPEEAPRVKGLLAPP
jgi:hypothetical protein